MDIQKNNIDDIPFIKYNFDSTNKELIFLHANAFPPNCYIPLFAELGKQFNIICPLFKPLWGNPDSPDYLKDWTPLKSDTVRFLENYGIEKINIAGHSLGGHIAFRIAIENPELIEKSILMDPIIFPKFRIFIWQFIQWTEFGKKIHPMIKASKNQKLIHNSNLELFTKYRTKKIFKNISDSNLKFLIDGLTKNRSDGKVEIAYPKDWEIQIYQSGGISDKKIWNNVKILDSKILLLHAEKTHAPDIKTIEKITLKSQNIHSILLKDKSHFFPFEIPDKIAKITSEFLANN